MTPKRDHITPVIAALHWLPVQQRVEFKVLLHTWKALNDEAPPYLKELLHLPSKPSRLLRSQNQKLLKPPDKIPNYVYYGERAFQYAAPDLWNKLPLDARLEADIHKFKTKLKSFLFRKAYL